MKKHISFLTALILCASMVCIPVSAEDNNSNLQFTLNEIDNVHGINVDGMPIRCPYYNQIKNYSHSFNTDFVRCIGTFEDNTLDIKFIVGDDSVSVPLHENADVPELITIGSVMANTNSKIEIITPNETTEVNDNFYKDILWRHWTDDEKQDYVAAALFEKASPIAITNTKQCVANGKFIKDTVLAEVKVSDYEYGTPIFVGENVFVVDTAENLYKAINKDFPEEASEYYSKDTIAIQNRCPASYIINSVFPETKNEEDLHVRAVVTEDANVQFFTSDADMNEYTKTLTAKVQNFFTYHSYLSSDDVCTASDVFSFSEPNDTYEAITAGADEKPKFENFTEIYGTGDSLTRGRYILGYETVKLDDIYYDMTFLADGSANITVYAKEPITYLEDTIVSFTPVTMDIELNDVLVKSLDIEPACVEIKANTTFDKDTLICSFNGISPVEELGVNPYSSGTGKYVTYYLAGKKIKTYLASNNGYTCAVQKAIGDSDRSGTVDILDVIQINKYLLGSGNIKDTEVADVDEDGQITSSDALNVLKIALDMLTSEEVNHLHLKK